MSAVFRMSVHRPANLGCRAWYVERLRPDSTNQPLPVELELEELHGEIYSWDPGEVDPASALERDKADQLHRLLIEPFQAAHPAQERTMDRLRRALEEIDEQIPLNAFTWVATTEVLPEGESSGEEATLEANVMLAFRQHMRWVHSIFQNVPNASVLIQ